MITNTTLCYVDDGNSLLMLHRTKKQDDINEGKWIGIGGHMQEGESPEDCILRETREETGCQLLGPTFRGIVTFVYRNVTEYMFLFTASGLSGEPTECDEGELAWIPKDRVLDLELWQGDRIFLALLADGAPFFSLKLVYADDDSLQKAVLDGQPLILP